MKRTKLVAILAVVVLSLTACMGQVDEAAQEQSRQTQNMVEEALAQAGMPRITNYTELKLVNYLYELRDQEGLSTYTYVVDLEGRLWHVCDSIGYGVPYSAQRTNPENPVVLKPGGSNANRGTFVLPQPEPNGLYPPTTSSATWVICAGPDGNPSPIYVEPLITVSTFPLGGAVGSWTKEEPPSPDSN